MRRVNNQYIPVYGLHKARGQARVILDGRHIYLGRYGSPESHDKYDRLIAEYLAAGRDLTRMPSLEHPCRYSVCDLILAFRDHAESYYVKDGKPTRTLANIRFACRRLRQLYGSLPVDEFRPGCLRALRETWIDDGNNVRTVNYKTQWIKHLFRWGVEHELVEPHIWEALRAVASLRSGRSRAKPAGVRGPVSRDVVDRTLGHLPDVVADMARVQLATCCRSSELCSMSWEQIDTSGQVWFFAPLRHKTQHHGKSKVIAIGPRAQDILETYRHRPPDAAIFSPAESERLRNGKRSKEARSPLKIGCAAEGVGEVYTPDSYRRAITRAAKAAGQPHWHPHQLRHLGATELCAEVGIEVAAAVLGNTLQAAQIYTDVNRALACRGALTRG